MVCMNERVYNGEIDRLRNQERLDRLEVNRVVKLLTENKNIKSILDVGTGSAVFAEAFFKEGLSVGAIDINPEMIEAAKNFLPNAIYKIAPAENIPFDDKSFDLVFMGLVFHEVNDYEKALSEARRVAKNLIAIYEWNYQIEEFGPPLEHRINPQTIKQLVEKLNLKNLTIINLSFLVLYLIKV